MTHKLFWMVVFKFVLCSLRFQGVTAKLCPASARAGTPSTGSGELLDSSLTSCTCFMEFYSFSGQGVFPRTVLLRCPSVCKGRPACTLVGQAQPRVPSSDISQLPVPSVAVGFMASPGRWSGTTAAPPQPCLGKGSAAYWVVVEKMPTGTMSSPQSSDSHLLSSIQTL